MPAEAVIDDDLDLDEVPEFISDMDSIQTDMMSNSPELVLPSGRLCQRDEAAVFQGADAGEMSAKFVIVTRLEERNRHGNMLHIIPSKYGKGIMTQSYEQNPVVLYDHGLSGETLPIGTSRSSDGQLALKLSKTKAIATVYFSKLPHAEPYFAAVNEGILRMASIGFNIRKAMLNKESSKEKLAEGVESWGRWRGYDFVETEMLEWSITPLGADRGSLIQCLESGKIHDVKLPQHMIQSFKNEVGGKQAWSPGMDFMQLSIGGGLIDMKGSHEQISQFLQSGSGEILQKIGKEFSNKQQKSPENIDTNRENGITHPDPKAESTVTQQKIVPPEELGNEVVTQLRQKKQSLKQVSDAISKGVMTAVNQQLDPIREGQKTLQQDIKTLTGKID